MLIKFPGKINDKKWTAFKFRMKGSHGKFMVVYWMNNQLINCGWILNSWSLYTELCLCHIFCNIGKRVAH